MKITSIDVVQIKTINPVWRPIVCRIYTDEGIFGDGEAAIAYCTGAPAAFGMIKDLAPLLIGRDPLDNEVIWEIMYKNTFWGQNGGPITFAGMSALDIALWDIKGKYFHVPLYKLLGGKKREKLRAYASQLQLGGWQNNIETWNFLSRTEDYYDAAKRAVDEGYDCVKVDVFNMEKDGTPIGPEQQTRLLKPHYVNLVEERIAAVRKAVGPNVDIIMENHSYPDAQSAIQLGKAVEKYNIFYFEEPNTPTPKLTKFIHDNVNIPIASGERIYSRWQYAPYFENLSLQVIQPDIGNSGGLTETKKICDMAHTYDIGVQAHVCASPFSTDVALHLEAVIPNFVIHEHHVFNRYKFNHNMTLYNNQPVDGYIMPSERPGVGNEFVEDVFKNPMHDKVTVK
jgi:L-alanine-DL-glutamate epimerase-like enolase superfamily enzyme